MIWYGISKGNLKWVIQFLHLLCCVFVQNTQSELRIKTSDGLSALLLHGIKALWRPVCESLLIFSKGRCPVLVQPRKKLLGKFPYCMTEITIDKVSLNETNNILYVVIDCIFFRRSIRSGLGIQKGMPKWNILNSAVP